MNVIMTYTERDSDGNLVQKDDVPFVAIREIRVGYVSITRERTLVLTDADGQRKVFALDSVYSMSAKEVN